MTIPAAVPVAVSALGALGGKGGSSKKAKEPETLRMIAEQLQTMTDPLRAAQINRSTEFLQGGLDVTQLPQFGALKEQQELSAQNARQNAIAQAAPGGQLLDALTGIETQKAGALSTGAANLAQDEINRALAQASGYTQQAMTLAQGGGQIQASKAINNAQQQAAQKQVLGSGLGAFLGSM